ncbi:MAG: hypothetical protein JXA21_16265 [Anaerolineae bacterium]|nr:hypothetical protein [Anaerolineae bacterium]
MFWNLWITEELRVSKDRLVWICLLILTGVLISDVLGQYFAASPLQNDSSTQIMIDGQTAEGSSIRSSQHTVQRSTWPTVFTHGLKLLRQYSWLTVIVIVGSIMGQEYLWHVPQFLLSRGISRLAFLSSRFMAFLLPVLCLVLLPIMCSSFLSALCMQALHGKLDMYSVDYMQLAVSVLATAYSLLPYAGLALLLAIVGRSFILPIGGGIAFVVIENLIYEQGIVIAKYMPYTLGASMANLYESIPVGLPDSSAMQAPMIETLGIVPSLLGILIWSGLFLALSVFVFLKQNYPE